MTRQIAVDREVGRPLRVTLLTRPEEEAARRYCTVMPPCYIRVRASGSPWSRLSRSVDFFFNWAERETMFWQREWLSLGMDAEDSVACHEGVYCDLLGVG